VRCYLLFAPFRGDAVRKSELLLTRPFQQPAPDRLLGNDVTAPHAYANAFFAVPTLEAVLPAVEGAKNAVVIFGLRGRESITTNGVVLLERYAQKLHAGGNKLMLVGVEPRVRRALDRTGITRLIGTENLFESTSNLGGPLNEALIAANEWVKRNSSERARTGSQPHP
jgi:sulfate permease, SulP family